MTEQKTVAFGFTTKELILLGGMLATIVSTWAVTQYRMGQLESLVQHNTAEQAALKESLASHVQWELQSKLHEKDAEIEALKAQLKGTK